MSERVLVVAAHADDESLGCGGTIAKHVKAGDSVTVLVLADGVSSRSGGAINLDLIKERHGMFKQACKVLGTDDVWLRAFPDNRMDTRPMLEVVAAIDLQMARVKPTVVYTHAPSDLNVDHRVTNEAVQVACRPQPGSSVRRLLYFEVLSSTEWGLGVFRPQHFEDISATMEQKLAALACYTSELRDYPHPRSIEGVRAWACGRGVTAGVSAAEAFMVGRSIS